VAIRELSHELRDWLRTIRRSVRGALRVDRGIAALWKLRPVNLIAASAIVPARSRAKLVRYAVRRLRPSQGNYLRCEINSLGEFESAYARLAPAISQAGQSPRRGDVEFLAGVEKKRRYYSGVIAPADVLFLTAFTSILAPPRVVEIGTLTGFSAGIIAAALARRHGRDAGVRVDTIDIHAECPVDPHRPTGFEIAEFFPDVAAIIRVHTPRDSTFIGQLAKREELELAFVDADHRHPLPLIDLLRLAPYLRPAGWILLHDIQLGRLTHEALAAGRQTPFEPVYGAEWLFNEWPWRKISGGNIGAIQLPNPKSALVPFALRMLRIPFEIPQKQMRATRRAVYEALAPLC
jgi:Methyltransferase domain